MKEKIENALNTMKLLGIDMIGVAGSGHPGITLGAAPIIYSLYANVLNINPADPNWINRDRFILSAGHGSALLYSTLHMAGYEISLDDLVKYRKLGSITPGHPVFGLTPGVDMTTGPLGQGFASAVGIALSERYLSNLLSEQVPKQKLIDYYTYVLASDGDLMEGTSYEAAVLAGQQRLNKLIVLYDSNDISSDGPLEYSTKEDVVKRFNSIGWNTDYVSEGANINSITKAINRAKRSNKPTLIEIKTIIGRGSFNENKNIVHGKPLTKDDVENLRRKMGVVTGVMEVNQEDVEFFRKTINNRTLSNYNSWVNYYQKFTTTSDPEISKILKFLINKDLGVDFLSSSFKIQDFYKEELRESNSKILNVISGKTPFFIGGSADLATSCKTNIFNSLEMSHNVPTGRNICFGVREHAMGSILNGMAMNGLSCYGSTFLAFADYMKPAIRMSAMMNLPVTYIFTHDSIDVGPDGATHQPIEQLTMLRSTPNLDIYRPADINEVIGCWEAILKRKKPSVLSLSKKTIEILKNSNGTEVSKGAYIIKKETAPLTAVIVSTGCEVSTVEHITQDMPGVRVVSMPSMELFLEQDNNYQNEILPKNIVKISVEAGSTMPFKGLTDYQIGIDTFGTSGSVFEVLDYYGFNENKLKEKIINILK